MTDIRDLGLKIVEIVELEQKGDRPCPLCLQYFGGHQAHCPYLFFFGWKLPLEGNPDEGSQTSRTKNLDADVVSDDETSLPATKPIKNAPDNRLSD